MALVRQWKLDETSGTAAADSSGNGDSGTYVGSPSLNQTGPGGSWTAAVGFDGSTQRVSALDTQATIFSSGLTGTVTGRIKCDNPSESTNAHIIVELGGAAVGMAVYMYGSTLYAGVSMGGIYYGVSGTLNDTNWHSFVFSCNLPAIELFIDGASVDTGTAGGGSLSGTNDSGIAGQEGQARTHLGTSNGSFDGLICDIRCYDDAKDVSFASTYHAEQAETLTYTIGAAGDYTSWGAAVSAFEAGTLSGAAIGDHIIFQEIDGAAYDEQIDVTANAGGYASLTLTASESARHDGTAGSGARIASTSNGDKISIGVDLDCTVEWLEVNSGGTSGDGIRLDHNNTSKSKALRYCIVHNIVDPLNCVPVYVYRGGRHEIHNNIVYNCTVNNAFSQNLWGIYSYLSPDPTFIYNNTVYDLHLTGGGTGNLVGIWAANNSNVTIRNNAVAGLVNDNSGSNECFSTFSSATASHNASDDTTHPGTSGQTIAGSDWVDAANGDFQPSSGSTLFEAGVDLGTTPTGVEVDITGRDRDASADTWSIGAWQLEAAATGLTLDASPASITATPQSAGLNISRTITASPATVTVTGQSSTLTVSAHGSSVKTFSAISVGIPSGL